jgi:beta-1,4-mannosyl-glycoprotein beta-1,4-N-acetylglucosaminyltransferase
MIIDAFPFFNELDLLEVRLETLDPVVDAFVLVEATKTQTLKEKPLFFKENIKRYEKFWNKIRHVIVDDCPKSNDHLWKMENFQRNCIKRGLWGTDPTDVVMVSDVDEIPDPSKIVAASKADGANLLAFDMSFHAYYANLVSPKKGWIGTVMTKMETLDVIEPQDIRNVKDSAPRIDNAGWHLSWLGGWEKAYTKLLSCIEPLDKSEVPSREEFERRFNERIKDGGHFHLTINDDSVPLVVDNSLAVPSYLQANREKFKHLFI